MRCHLPGISPSDRVQPEPRTRSDRLCAVFLSSRSPELCLMVVDTLSHPCLSLFLHLMHPLSCFSCICLLGSVHSPGTGYRVNILNKRAFNKVGPGDDLTPVTRLRNYSYFNSDKPRGMLFNMCYYVQRVFYETTCLKALLYAVKPRTPWPPALLLLVQRNAYSFPFLPPKLVSYEPL